jgi:hypothetical protein
LEPKMHCLTVNDDGRSGNDQVIPQAQVVGSSVDGLGSQPKEGSSVEDGIVRVDVSRWDGTVSGVVTGLDERTGGDVELGGEDTGQVVGLSDVGSQNGLVRVVVGDVHAGHVVGQLELSDVGGDESSSVGGDGGLESISSKVGVVVDGKGGVDGPLDSGVLSGTLDQVGRQQGPSHGLGDTGLEPDGHGERTGHLPEDHLLPSLGSDGLQQELSSRSRVEGGEETVDTGFTESGQDLETQRGSSVYDRKRGETDGSTYGTELDKFLNGVEVVLVLALLGTGTLKDVGQQGGVTDLLVGHELDQELLLGIDTLSGELLRRESGETVVEEVELDPF